MSVSSWLMGVAARNFGATALKSQYSEYPKILNLIDGLAPALELLSTEQIDSFRNDELLTALSKVETEQILLILKAFFNWYVEECPTEQTIRDLLPPKKIQSFEEQLTTILPLLDGYMPVISSLVNSLTQEQIDAMKA